MLKHGDKNSNFFHASTAFRRKRNLILGIDDKNGAWQTGSTEVENLVLDYFKDMFSANVNCDPDITIGAVDHRVTEEMNNRLTRKVTSEEVKRVLFEMPADKSPGPDVRTRRGEFIGKYGMTSLLVKLLKGRYYRRSSFLHAKVRGNSSFGWRSLLEGRQVLKKGMRWLVGDGKDIDIWKDPWMSRINDFVTRDKEHHKLGKVSQLIWDGTWKVEVVKELFADDDAYRILAIPLNKFHVRDKLGQGCFELLSKVASVLWQLWKHRNNVIFDEGGGDMIQIWCDGIKIAMDYDRVCSNIPEEHTIMEPATYQGWKLPSHQAELRCGLG
ncbi:hypothetical protein LIER_32936 [Lithospermum erythrorhizon]|uniref:Uncharacterized protein n=1 Tax=Lithospermum erythrorhizon TaxID=34254 RepID=A0AAV3RX00_LITER